MDVEKTMQFLLEQQARFDARQAQSEAKSEEYMTQIKSVLLDVATAQAKTNAILTTLTERHVELAESHMALTEAQRVTEQNLNALSEAQRVTEQSLNATEQNLNALISVLERHIANHK